MLEKILPADGTKTVGELFYEVLEGTGKLQNFAVYMEGSRVPLDFNVDTSVLVGQKVLIKYLPGPCKFSYRLLSKISHCANCVNGCVASAVRLCGLYVFVGVPFMIGL
jgi:hypothetical protein